MVFMFKVALLLFGLSFLVRAEEKRVLFLGDSITQDGRWATQVEGAMRLTKEYRDAEIVNMGLGSETVSGLSEPNHAEGKFPRPDLHERLGRVLAGYKPTLVIACYGMNDGIYLPLDGEREKAFRKGAIRLKDEVEEIGGRIIFLTAPLFMPDTPEKDTQGYDKVLDAYAAWLVSKEKDGWKVVDIRPSLKQSVARMKTENPAFVYAKDGVHPGADGHRFIAAAACKGLWPLLGLEGEPVRLSDDALAILSKRQNLLKYAWLSETKHLRPGIKAGLPLDEAKQQASGLLEQFRQANGGR